MSVCERDIQSKGTTVSVCVCVQRKEGWRDSERGRERQRNRDRDSYRRNVSMLCDGHNSPSTGD